MSDSPGAALTTFLAQMAVDPAAFARYVADADAAVTGSEPVAGGSGTLFSGDQNRGCTRHWQMGLPRRGKALTSRALLRLSA